jgi:hypothetical protein
MKRRINAAIALAVLAAPLELNAACPPRPAPPPQDTLWAVQISDTEWRLEVPGWVEVLAPVCWALGRVPLEYTGTDNGTELVTGERSPWIEGLDYPLGAACPAEALGNCWASRSLPE